VFLCCKRAIMQMSRQEPVNEVRGRSSTSRRSTKWWVHLLLLRVSKGGVVQMTRQLAVDYAKEGILVNAVAPGRIVTGTHPGTTTRQRGLRLLPLENSLSSSRPGRGRGWCGSLPRLGRLLVRVGAQPARRRWLDGILSPTLLPLPRSADTVRTPPSRSGDIVKPYSVSPMGRNLMQLVPAATLENESLTECVQRY
jgi:NAD(P)-dependent dehydrogenase (short-subunit alcohol dehydrogenase family)